MSFSKLKAKKIMVAIEMATTMDEYRKATALFNPNATCQISEELMLQIKKRASRRRFKNNNPKLISPRKLICPLCGIRNGETRHHLIPKDLIRSGLVEPKFITVFICEPCHKFIHKKFTNFQLGTELNNIDKLRTAMHKCMEQLRIENGI